MNLDDKHERVPVPKWRALSNTPSAELVSAESVQPDQELALARADRMHALHARWQEAPTIDNALELLDCSSFIDDKGLFYGPAAQIINSGEVTRTSKLVAQFVIRPERIGSSPSFDVRDREHVSRAIAKNRRRLRDQARNGLLHAEQARLYAIIDEAQAAENSFARALAVTPDNRHILRSFARFMVHVGQPEVALRKLRKSAAISSDSWVQAAEIAISEYHNVGSLVAKSASRMLDAVRIRREHASELATALATLERHSGHRKRFNKRLKESLSHPSENALAQATWLIREAPGDLSEDLSQLLLPMFDRSAEARTYALLKQRHWGKAVKSFARWQDEESFSEHIAIEGSFYAISFANDYDAAISLCRNGLIANSTSHGLLNNLCYAERRRGLLDGAVKTMTRLKSVCSSWKSSPVYLATDGMLNFALGNRDVGRAMYLDALVATKVNKDDSPSRRIKIKMHWLQEEALSGAVTKLQAERLISLLQSELEESGNSGELSEYWKNIKDQIEAVSARSGELHSQQRAEPHFIESHL